MRRDVVVAAMCGCVAAIAMLLFTASVAALQRDGVPPLDRHAPGVLRPR